MKKNNSLQIQLIEQTPEHFAQVAQWHHQECERQGLKSTLATRQKRLLNHLQSPIPKTLILRDSEKVLGCVSLVNYSYRSDSCVPIPRKQEPLWLVNLFVVENNRCQGFGNLLIEAAKKYAQQLGWKDLWLSASDYTDYYEKRGWIIVRNTRLGGKLVNVMRIELINNFQKF